MTGLTHITLGALNCRAWWEFVPSEVNLADGLSRDGLNDAWTREQPWDLEEVQLPDFAYLMDKPLHTLLEHFAEHHARLPEAEVRAAPVTWKIPEVSQEDQAAWLRREQRALAEAITEAQIPPPAPPGTSAGAGQGTLLLHLRPCGPAPCMRLGNSAREDLSAAPGVVG